MRFVIPLIAIVLIAGCTQQTPITEVMIPGHGSQIYQFSYDIRESVKVAANDEPGIRNLIRNSDRLAIIFNETATGEEKSMFQQLVINVANKLPTYFSYEGKLLAMNVLYYGEDGYLYNGTRERTELPPDAKVMLLGPTTGATGTSVNIKGDIITLQGMDRKGVVLAGDKLALIVMGIDEQKIRQMSTFNS